MFYRTHWFVPNLAVVYDALLEYATNSYCRGGPKLLKSCVNLRSTE